LVTGSNNIFDHLPSRMVSDIEMSVREIVWRCMELAEREIVWRCMELAENNVI
jgi:hypothetical protein